MKTLFDTALAAETRRRMGRLMPETPAHWGRMSASQMVCHLIDGFRVPLGEQQVIAPRKTPFRFKPLRWLFLFVLPWPKGKVPTMPEFQATTPGQWEADQTAWADTLERFVARGRAGGAFAAHPAFGPLSIEEWGRLAAAHTDHHLRQFGV